MCMSLRIEPREMAEVIIKIRKMSLAQEMSIKHGKRLIMSGDLYPSDIVPVLAPNKYGNMAIFPMAWGFTHQATPKPLVNCRVETADSKPLWRDSWYRRRCVIPASWYYEWGYPVYEDDSRNMIEHCNTQKVKFAIQTEGSDRTYIAGLYRYEAHDGMQIPMFSILTREAVGTVTDIHDRMPLILDKEDVNDWIRPKLQETKKELNMGQKEIIDKDTYRIIKKMNHEELTKFILQYSDQLLGEQGKTIDLPALEIELSKIKGIGGKRLDEIMTIIEKFLQE